MNGAFDLRQSFITAGSLAASAVIIYGLELNGALLTKVVTAIIFILIFTSFIKSVWKV